MKHSNIWRARDELAKKIEAYYDDFGKLHLPQIDDRNLTSTKSDDKDSANTKDRIEYLANLSSYEYGLIRRQEAKALGLNVSFLDKSIREAKSIRMMIPVLLILNPGKQRLIWLACLMRYQIQYYVSLFARRR